MSTGFETIAEQWLGWARAPGHDAYWWTRTAFFALVPPPDPADPRVLEVGCGEGRVARDLAARGFAVTALDASPTLLEAARAADPASRYVVGAPDGVRGAARWSRVPNFLHLRLVRPA